MPVLIPAQYGGDPGIRPRFLLHDRDRYSGGDFEAMAQSAGVGSLATPYRAHNANAFVESWIRSTRGECLDHLVFFGLKRLRRAVHTYRAFHNEHRPHQGIGNHLPRAVHTDEPAPEMANGPIGTVHCEASFCGLLKSYHRAA